MVCFDCSLVADARALLAAARARTLGCGHHDRIVDAAQLRRRGPSDRRLLGRRRSLVASRVRIRRLLQLLVGLRELAFLNGLELVQKEIELLLRDALAAVACAGAHLREKHLELRIARHELLHHGEHFVISAAFEQRLSRLRVRPADTRPWYVRSMAAIWNNKGTGWELLAPKGFPDECEGVERRAWPDRSSRIADGRYGAMILSAGKYVRYRVASRVSRSMRPMTA
jgi:hypothetical protein